MSSSSPGPRFLLRRPGGDEDPIRSVEELQRRIEEGEILPDAELFDASTGTWSPAGDMPVYRFIVEELEMDGRLPAPLRAALEGPASAQEEDAFTLGMDLVEAGPDPGQTREEASPAEDTSRESDEETDPPEPESEADWFTPASEGGMVLGGPEEGRDAPSAPPPELWQPEQGEPVPGSASRTRRLGARPRVVGLLVLLALAASTWFLVVSPYEEEVWMGETGSAGVVVEAPSLPPFPEGLDAAGERVVAGIGAAFLAAGDSLRDSLDLAQGPPEPWLSGVYFANASDFPAAAEFWEGYRTFLDELRPRDEEVYRRGVDEAVARLEGLSADERDRLRSHFAERYGISRRYRDSRYDHLRDAAWSALRLHELLIRHEEVIRHSPALGQGVSEDPILEAVIPEGPVRREVERALDQVFRALDRSRAGDGAARAPDELPAELFRSFGDPSAAAGPASGATSGAERSTATSR